MYRKKTYFTLILCHILCMVLWQISSQIVHAAAAQPSEEVDLLPSIEITPEQMQKYFPAPLRSGAKNIPLLPTVTPLEPASPQGKNAASQPSVPVLPSVAAPKKPSEHPRNDLAPSIPETHDYLLNFINPRATQRDNRPNLKHIPLNSTDTAPTAINPATAQPNTVPQAFSPLAHNMPGFPSLEIMIGQMIMAGFTGTDLDSSAPIMELIKAGKIGGVFLEAMPSKEQSSSPVQTPLPMLDGGTGGKLSPNNQTLMAQNSIKVPLGQQGNIASPSQLRMLIASLQRAVPRDAIPLWVAVEQEGGAVQSLRKDLGFEGLASAAFLGQESVEKTEIAARRAGLEMASLGINFVLGPAGDVNVNPLSENIGQRFRSFGIDERQVTAHVHAFSKGMLATKVLPCIRNFPGTGSVVRGFMRVSDTQNNTKNLLHSIPDMAASWNERELYPYKQDLTYAIQPALIYHRGLDALRPAPLSSSILNTVLRENLGFQGIILSEDLRSLQAYFSLEDSILQAIQAGTDILLITEPAAHATNTNPLQGFGSVSKSNIITEILSSASTEQGNSSSADISKMLLKQSLGKVLPGAFQAEVRANPTAGMATEAAKVYDILLRLVRNGSISHERIAQSWQRIQLAKKHMELY